MAHQTMIFNMFQQMGKIKHKEALQHEAKRLIMNNQNVFLQTIVEKNKHPVGRPKLQPHMT
jgi:hypothetical protein